LGKIGTIGKPSAADSDKAPTDRTGNARGDKNEAIAT